MLYWIMAQLQFSSMRIAHSPLNHLGTVLSPTRSRINSSKGNNERIRVSSLIFLFDKYIEMRYNLYISEVRYIEYEKVL